MQPIRWIAHLCAVVRKGTFCCALVAAAANVTLAADSRLVDAFRNDATLRAVHFTDPQHGWAVGDHAAIWHTADGGRTWQLQSAPVECTLSGVWFVDPQHGWAVGGYTKPYLHTTKGVVLHTEDGGNTWQQVPHLTLPRLAGVQMFDRQRGTAWGAGSTYHPSGAFTTKDGGHTWQSIPTEERGGWLAAHWPDGRHGALLSVEGRVAVTATGELVQPGPAAGRAALGALRFADPTHAWLVGERNHIFHSADGGRTWLPPPGLPSREAETFDFHAVAAEAGHVWVAGAPGNVIWHSSNQGTSWQPQPTGITVPIRALSIADATRGWAVGDLGTILATSDGGQTWHVQRSGGKQLSVLAVFARPEDVPLEMLADLSAAEGYLSGVDVLFLNEASIRKSQTTDDAARRTEEALLLAGATAAQVALPRASEFTSQPALENYLARRLRMWRPDVVVTHHGDAATTGDQRGQLIALAVERAVTLAAADLPQRAERRDGGSATPLPPWRVKRVYGLLPSPRPNSLAVSTGTFSPRLGSSPAEWTTPARGLLNTSPIKPPETLAFQLTQSRLQTTGGRDLMSGLHVLPGGDARRHLVEPSPDDMDQIRRLAQAEQQMESMLAWKQSDSIWATQVIDLTGSLDADRGAELLLRLAEQYRAAGLGDMAIETLYLLARRYPQHPLCDFALARLIQFYSSDETALGALHMSSVDAPLAGSMAQAASFNSPTSPSGENVAALSPREAMARQATQAAIQAAVVKPVERPPLSRSERLQRASLMTDYLQQARPELFAEPYVKFPLAVAHRKRRQDGEVERYLRAIGQLPADNPWYRVAMAEESIRRQSAAGIVPVAACRATIEPPVLDGRIEELFWLEAQPIVIADRSQGISESSGHASTVGPRAASQALVRLARDERFLYLAVQCTRVRGQAYRKDNRPRPRDADLSRHDRVCIRLDLDRDYTTAFELTVDHRGWTHDACWGNAAWNPTWYVAADDDGAQWTVEAAIPLAELAETPPAAGEFWAVGARRVTAKEGATPWQGTSADAASPASFGWVVFE